MLGVVGNVAYLKVGTLVQIFPTSKTKDPNFNGKSRII